MGLIAFMHDYEFVRLGFFVLQTSEHFVPLPPSLTLLLPSLEFALPVSSALALSRTREKENERKRESSTHLCPPYRGFSALFSRHPLTHSSTRSLVPRSTRPRALPPPLSFNHPPTILFFLFLHRASSSPRFSPSSSSPSSLPLHLGALPNNLSSSSEDAFHSLRPQAYPPCPLSSSTIREFRNPFREATPSSASATTAPFLPRPRFSLPGIYF